MHKSIKYISKITITAAAIALSACSVSGPNQSEAKLSKVLDIAKNTMTRMNLTDSKVKASESADLFAINLTDAVNYNKVYNQQISIIAQKDGSFDGFYDNNLNNIKDSSEKSVFKLEVDGNSNKLIASNSDSNKSVSSGFNMSGLFMGMMIGNLLSRQSSSGISREQMSRKSSSARSSSSVKSAINSRRASSRSRAGSGSFSRGK